MAKIKIGVLGAGKMGTLHAKVLSRMTSDFELVGLCDKNKWRARMTAWRYGTEAYRDIDALLKKIDALVVALPTELHYDFSKRALERGVHVLIEKPIAESEQQAKDLVNLAQEKGLILQVGHVERFNPAVLQGVQYIKDPKFIKVERLGPYDPRMSGIGVVMDLMIHDLDILLTLVPEEVVDVQAIGAKLLSPHEDIVNVRLRFASGCVADLTASRISLEKSRKIRVFQKESYVSIDYANAKLKIAKKKKPVIKSLLDVEVQYPRLEQVQPLEAEHLHFKECIEHSRTPWTSGEAGIRAIQLAFEIVDQLERFDVSNDAIDEKNVVASMIEGAGIEEETQA